MSINKLELINALNKIAPITLAEVWDNCGMQIDLGENNINKIIVTLEITGNVIEEAKLYGADFIVTHHPLFFSKINKIDNNDVIGKYTVDLIKHGISVYSAHTNFDKAKFGNNFYLAKLLNLTNLVNFENFGEDYIGLFGKLVESMDFKTLIKEIEHSLNLQPGEIKAIGDLDKKISRVGLCTGSGIDMLEVAALNGCELFITGDVKYHDAMKAKEIGMNVVDAGHYGTEKFFVPNMANQLKQVFGSKVEILQSEIDINPFIKYGEI